MCVKSDIPWKLLVEACKMQICPAWPTAHPKVQIKPPGTRIMISGSGHAGEIEHPWEDGSELLCRAPRELHVLQLCTGTALQLCQEAAFQLCQGAAMLRLRAMPKLILSRNEMCTKLNLARRCLRLSRDLWHDGRGTAIRNPFACSPALNTRALSGTE